MTDIKTEREEQRRWQPIGQYFNAAWFNQLVENEFLPDEQQSSRQIKAVKALIKYVTSSVPFYKKLFHEIGISEEDIQNNNDLRHIPVLTRGILQTNYTEIRATRLPPGHKIVGFTKTSGSTGQPVKVLATNFSTTRFGICLQRAYRWFRFDPLQKMAFIRNVEDLPVTNGEHIKNGMTCNRAKWLYVGEFFNTGPFIGFSHKNPPEEQIAWLHEHKPAYLTTMPATLEQLALTGHAYPPPDSLSGLQAIAQQLTTQMRERIENTFNLPVNQGYGLNEIGLVAARCPEGGRYHVHAGHCLVEIIDDKGQPCKTGETGHLLATSFSNAAMPLIRYDTGDLAIQVDGSCPCGRTLPAFGEIRGRYRRIASLPPEIWDQWGALQRALDEMPEEIMAPLRQFQLHHYRNGNFKLRLAVAVPLSDEFKKIIHKYWEGKATGNAPKLEIEEMDLIPHGPGVKFDSFTSDLFFQDINEVEKGELDGD